MSGSVRARRFAMVALSGLVASGGLVVTAGAAGAAAPLQQNCSQNGATVTCNYFATGESTFTVPAGVTSLNVQAEGGTGGAPSGTTAAFAGDAIGTLGVQSGQTLYLEVGGQGQLGTGGANGGGDGGASGYGGGGASDIRTISSSAATGSLDSRLVVGPGSGGMGGSGTCTGGSGGYAEFLGNQSTNSNGKNAGSGNNACTSSRASGGRGATQTGGGAGGQSDVPADDGQAGTHPTGGAGGGALGGGGGGGYYGGGGGAEDSQFGGAGGGGGSFLLPPGGDRYYAVGMAAIQISYTDPAAQTAPGISGTPPDGNVNSAYDFSYTLSGTPTPTTTVTSGTLPPGLTLSNAGELSGTPTAAGSYTFTVTATNGVDPAATTEKTVVVDESPTIQGSPPSGSVGSGYDFSYYVTGNPTPTTTVTSGALPPGLSLSDTGRISGTPTTVGNYSFYVTASNSSGGGGTSISSVIEIDQAPGVSGSAPDTTLGAEYDFTYSLTGTPTPTTSVTHGTLPPGLSLSATGDLSGTTTSVGTYTFTVTASNGVDPAASIEDTVVVRSAPTIAGSPPDGTAGSAYAFSYSLSGSPAPSATVTAGTLPPGLSLSSAGRLSGTPTQAGNFTFTVTASNGVVPAASTQSTVVIGQASTAPGISGTPTQGGLAEPYSFTFTKSGSPAPTVTKSSGTLPPGLTLSSAGKLSGTPTKAGSYTFTAKATSSKGSASKRVTVVIRPYPTLTIADTKASEGNSGTKPLTFQVTLNRSSTLPVTVKWSTANNSATAPSDYVAASGTLTFAAGQTSKTITVTVKGDRTKEKNEVFLVRLSNPTRATIADGSANGGILNDD